MELLKLREYEGMINWIIEIMFENIVLWKLIFLMVIIKFKIVRIKICYNINF